MHVTRRLRRGSDRDFAEYVQGSGGVFEIEHLDAQRMRGRYSFVGLAFNREDGRQRNRSVTGTMEFDVPLHTQIPAHFDVQRRLELIDAGTHAWCRQRRALPPISGPE